MQHLFFSGLFACCMLRFPIFKCFVDVAKRIMMLRMFHARGSSVSFECCIFNKAFECSSQHEVDVAAGFSPFINSSLSTIF
jgi:hypothetical protein